MSDVDNFNGSNEKLCAAIDALLALDAKGVLVPHGVGGHARTMLSAAACRLRALEPEQDALTPSQWEQMYLAQCSTTDKLAEKLEAGSDKALLTRIAELESDLASMNRRYVAASAQ